MNWLLSLLACALLVSAVGARAQSAPSDVTAYAQGRAVPFDEMVSRLAGAQVVFVGELHDHKAGHALELELLRALHARQPRLGLSLEMFERDVQGVLDEYLAGHITDTHFRSSARPWPSYATDYAPLVEFCKAHRLPVVAANPPRRYVNIVSRKGPGALADLPKAAKETLPPLPYSLKLPDGYDRALDAVFGPAHGGDGPPPPGMPSPANLKAAQALWDAGMADSIARALKRRGGPRSIVAMNGAMHSDFGYGAAARLRDLMSKARVVVVTIRPSAAYPALPADLKPDVADFVLVTPPDPKPAKP